MAYAFWDGTKIRDITAERIQAWRASADAASALVVAGLSEAQWTALSTEPGLNDSENYQGSDGTLAVRWLSDQGRAHLAQKAKEHQELLLILQEALIHVAEHNTDLASKLAARAYVNLKTDSIGQRRYDGLLHRFTGVLHRKQETPRTELVPDDSTDGRG